MRRIDARVVIEGAPQDRAPATGADAVMTPERRAAVEERLGAEREHFAAIEAGLVSELAAIVAASDGANLDDEHDPEGSTVGYERARVASLLDAVRTRAADVVASAQRLRNETYGKCARCGQPIAPERLAAHPTAVACMSCATGAVRRFPPRARRPPTA